MKQHQPCTFLWASCLTCTGHPGGRSSAGAGSSAADLPPPGRNRRARWFSSSSHHTGCWCRGRTGHPGCTLQARALGSAAGPGGTCAGCIGWCQGPVWCRPEHILIAENHTSHKGHSLVLPSSIGSLHPAAWKMRLRKGWGWRKVQLHNYTCTCLQKMVGKRNVCQASHNNR